MLKRFTNASLRDIAAKSRPLFSRGLATLFPARCAACREAVAEHGALCAPCWRNIHFLADPLCHRCGLPFEFALGAGTLCGRCMQSPPAYTQARALFRYDEHSKDQLLAFKYHDKTQLAPVFGQWLARAAQSFARDAQAIVPVPLHYWRLVARRYNQAALLAQAVGRHTGLPILPDTLRRCRATPPQAGLSRRGREENVRGAFRVNPQKREALKGKSVLLIDDVMTTGATLDACARALHDSGVRDVYVLTLARTVLAD